MSIIKKYRLTVDGYRPPYVFFHYCVHLGEYQVNDRQPESLNTWYSMLASQKEAL